jgi:hypothetical protein
LDGLSPTRINSVDMLSGVIGMRCTITLDQPERCYSYLSAMTGSTELAR